MWSRFRVRAGMIVIAAVAGLVGTLAAANPSFASGYWSAYQNTSSPAIYQTNLYYQGAAFNPPAGTPGSAITTISYKWTMLDPPPSGLIYTVYLCQGTSGLSACILVSPNYATQSYTGSTSGFAGYAANNSFHYAVAILAGSTYVLPSARFSSYYSVGVNY